MPRVLCRNRLFRFLPVGLLLTLLVAGGNFHGADDPVEYLRGDTNQDGSVSISDAHYLLSWLYRGGAPPRCMSSADINLDNSINLTDSFYLFEFLMGRQSMCEPFPEPGPGPEDELGCSSYGGGEPLEDPEARLEIVGGVVDADGHVTLQVLVSSSAPIAGLSGIISVENDILANGNLVESVEVHGLMEPPNFNDAMVLGNDLRFVCLVSLISPLTIPAGTDVTVLELRACIVEGTPAGEYDLTLQAGELVDPDSGRAIPPALVAGKIVVPAGMGEDAGCESGDDHDPYSTHCSPADPPDPPDPPLPPAEESVDFLRGDTNGDGVLSISDAYHITSNYSLGKVPLTCLSSADLDNSGSLGHTDAAWVLNYLFLGGGMPCEPFPEVGPWTPSKLTCPEYGGGEPLVDPTARMEILGGEVGEDGRATLQVLVSSSRDIAGLSGVLSVEDDIFANQERATLTDISRIVDGGFYGGRVMQNQLNFGMLVSFRKPIVISTGVDVAVLEIDICIEEGTPAGEYALTLEEAEFADSETARAIHPALAAGTLVVPSGLGAGAGCVSGIDPEPTRISCGDGTSSPPPRPPPPPPSPYNVKALCKIKGTSTAPGQSFAVPFIIHADHEVQAFAFSADFDEEILTATDIDKVYEKPDGSEYSFQTIEFNNENLTPGNGGIDEGYLIGTVIFSFKDNDNNLPPDQDNEVLSFQFEVQPDVAAESTRIVFLDGGRERFHGHSVRNVLMIEGEFISPLTTSTFIMLNGLIKIQAGESEFLRGDTNGDLQVDLADAKATLSYLFLSDFTPPCFEATDFDDSGLIDITDPIATLQYLFLGGPAPPPPFPGPGLDPTPDDMDCLTPVFAHPL